MTETLVHEIRALVQALHGMASAISNRHNEAVLERIAQMERNIMATQAELASDLKAVLAQQVKTAAEIASVQASVDTLNAKIVELEAVIASGGTGTASQELTDAVAAVKAQAEQVDLLIPDLPAPPVV